MSFRLRRHARGGRCGRAWLSLPRRRSRYVVVRHELARRGRPRLVTARGASRGASRPGASAPRHRRRSRPPTGASAARRYRPGRSRERRRLGDRARRWSPGRATRLPRSQRSRDVAAGDQPRYSDDGGIDGAARRACHAEPVADGVAVQVARPLDEVDRTLGRLAPDPRCSSASAASRSRALLGVLVARPRCAPCGRLTEAAEHVARDARPLAGASRPSGDDELERLGGERSTRCSRRSTTSLRAQRQLVADASHELRTPLTSLRTNVEVLARGKTLPEPRSASGCSPT